MSSSVLVIESKPHTSLDAAPQVPSATRLTALHPRVPRRHLADPVTDGGQR